jgi:hypothetical protein
MSLTLPPVSVLLAAFAADPNPGASDEARQTAARVRVSMLTRDWRWLHEGLDQTGFSGRETDALWRVLIGLAKWTQSSTSIDILRMRLDILSEAGKFPGFYSSDTFADSNGPSK